MTTEYKTTGQRMLEQAAELDADLDRLEEIEKILRQKYPELLKSDPELGRLILNPDEPKPVEEAVTKKPRKSRKPSS